MRSTHKRQPTQWQLKVSAEDKESVCMFANDLGESDSETEEDNSLFIVNTDVAEAEEGSDGDNHQVQALLRKFTKKGKAVHRDIETARKQLVTNANVAHHQVGLKRKGEDVNVR